MKEDKFLERFALLRQKALWLATGRILRRSKGASSVAKAAMEDMMAGQDGVLGFAGFRPGFAGGSAEASKDTKRLAAGCFTVVVLGVSLAALPWPVFAVETGNGTNQTANLNATNSITLRGATITEWPQGGSITNNQIQTDMIQTGAVTSVQIANNTINSTNIAVGGISNVNIGAGAITSNKIDWSEMPAGLVDGTVASNWANFPALKNVNIGGNSITNSPQVERWDNAVVMREGGGGSLTFSNLYYYKSDGSWAAANASTTNTARGLLGLALGASVTNDGLLLNGYCTNNWGFAVGSVIYMDTNNGALATSKPTGAHNIVRIVGYTISPTKIYFNPDRVFIKVAGN